VGRGAVLNSADDEGTPADTTAVRNPVGALASARLTSRAEHVLLDWLEAHIALQSLLDHDGVEGWEHRSVYELVATHGRWFTPAVLPAQVRPLPERECFANAAATEREHPHLAYTEGFAVAADSPVPTAHAWCTDADGHVIDPTWSALGGSAYLGIVLPPEPAAARASQLGRPGSTRLPVPTAAQRPVSRAACVQRRPCPGPPGCQERSAVSADRGVHAVLASACVRVAVRRTGMGSAGPNTALSQAVWVAHAFQHVRNSPSWCVAASIPRAVVPGARNHRCKVRRGSAGSSADGMTRPWRNSAAELGRVRVTRYTAASVAGASELSPLRTAVTIGTACGRSGYRV